jgi:hypothetical protein
MMAFDGVGVVRQLVGLPELAVVGEHALDVRVAHEADAVDAVKDAGELRGRVDRVLGEEVLVDRLARRAVDEQVVALALAHGEEPQEVPALARRVRVLPAVALELLARPVRGLLGDAVEVRRLVEDAEVVVAEQRPLAALRDGVGALHRVGAVADDVPEAQDALAAALVDLGQHRLEGGEVRVDVADEGGAHVGS